LVQRAIHCINPNCPRPYPKTWGSKFCDRCGAPLQLKGRYVPLQKLGAGGFATIYTVWDLQLQTQQVLKILVDSSPKALELFKQEAAVLQHLQHPGVPRVEPDGYFQIDLEDSEQLSLPCLVMEKINGQTLEEVLETHPQGCPEEWVLAWLKQAIEILHKLHNRQIIHRDIKPSNLMLRESTGQLVLIDFGGAKQIAATSRLADRSTRLFTSGYSPPEQIVGGIVGPAADFYALGRTMIEMLSGKSISDLQDPMTGKLQWRSFAHVSPAIANLLDDMVQDDVRYRPANALIIQERLTKAQKPLGWLSWLNSLLNSWKNSRIVFRSLTVGLSKTTVFFIKAITHALRASFDTFWEMLLGASGSCVATLVGFVLAYWSPLGNALASLLSQQLTFLLATQITVAADVLLFAVVGMGTAWGLTAAGGFGQQRRYLIAALMGLFGYSLSWLVWQLLMWNTGDAGIAGAIAIAVAFLTLGLGLPSHYLVHSTVTAVGCAAVFLLLTSLNLYPPGFWNLPITTSPTWLDLAAAIAFFATLGMILGFWLGISYYVVVPILRYLGWR
jgi:serine/threonine protein kinase